MEDLIKKYGKYFEFLESLRRSGVTNMYGATPYLIEAFNLRKDIAHLVLSTWIRKYNELSEYYNWRGKKNEKERQVKEDA